MDKKNFPTFIFVKISFFTWKPNPHWDLGTAEYKIFAKLVLDIFAVSSLVSKINLSHT